MRRRVGLEPPIRADGAGGRGGTGAYIGFWWKGRWYPGVFFDVAERISKTKHYPAGALLCRVYRGILDQGHVQVVLGNGYVLDSAARVYPLKKPGCTSKKTLRQVQSRNYMQYAVAPIREDGRGWLQR